MKKSLYVTLFFFLGVITFLIGLLLWFYSSIQGGFDTELKLRAPLWIALALASYVIMTIGPTLWLFAVPAYYAWKRKWPKVWRILAIVCFILALGFDFYFFIALCSRFF